MRETAFATCTARVSDAPLTRRRTISTSRCGVEDLPLAERRAAGVGEAYAQELARVVPLVEPLHRVDPLVALEADRRRAQLFRKRLRPPGFALFRLALEHQGLRQAHAQEHRR